MIRFVRAKDSNGLLPVTQDLHKSHKKFLKKAKNKKALKILPANNNNATAITEENPKEENKQIFNKKKNKEHKRRKPKKDIFLRINGEEKKLILFKGFPVLEADFNQLIELEESLVSKGVPHSEIQKTMKTQKRKAERKLSRLRKSVCIQCKEAGHVLSNCPQLGENSLIATAATGNCYKCGSIEHSQKECKVISKEYKFAKCFICKEQGHISTQCPDNPKGLYPKGEACKICGDVTHLQKDCPTFMSTITD